MEQVLTKALAFVAVIALGYFLKKRGFFKPHDYELIAKIVLNITLPCAVITSFAAFKMDYTLFILWKFADDCLGIYIDALSDECGKDFLRI